MIGRTPGYIVAVRPRGGAITDFEITQRMIRLLFQRRREPPLSRVSSSACRPPSRTSSSGRCWKPPGGPGRRRPSSSSSPWRPRSATPDPRADGQHDRRHRWWHHRGRGDLTRRRGCARGGPCRLVRHRRRDPDVRTARIRHRHRRAHGGGDQARDRLRGGGRRRVQAEVRGRDLMSGLPKTILLVPEEVRRRDRGTGRRHLRRRDRVSQTPPELAQDLILNGVHLVGGGGMLRGLDRRLSEETDLPVHLVGAPLEVRRARRRPLPGELRLVEGDVHGAQCGPVAPTDPRPSVAADVR